MKTKTPRTGILSLDNRKRQPLESYPLDSLRMVGTIKSRHKRWALVKTPDGAVHQVAKGDFVGKHAGKIVRVSKRKLEIVEKVADQSGQVERRTSMTLTEMS